VEDRVRDHAVREALTQRRLLEVLIASPATSP
jgi:hypothetical protein